VLGLPKDNGAPTAQDFYEMGWGGVIPPLAVEVTGHGAGGGAVRHPDAQDDPESEECERVFFGGSLVFDTRFRPRFIPVNERAQSCGPKGRASLEVVE
jgi:hypothetical protein